MSPATQYLQHTFGCYQATHVVIDYFCLHFDIKISLTLIDCSILKAEQIHFTNYNIYRIFIDKVEHLLTVFKEL
jgi:hypothetical protein